MRWLLVLLALCGLGASPVAVIRLPKEIEESQEIVPGDPIDLDGSSSVDAKVYAWRVEPSALPNGRPTFRMSDDRKRITLYSREGTYTIRLLVANDDDIADATRIVVVGRGKWPTPAPKPEPTPTPQPNPTPVPAPQPQPPEQTFGLIEVVKASVAKNVPVDQRKAAQGFAEAYRHGAEQLSSGKWTTLEVVVDGKRTIDCVARQLALNRTVAGYEQGTWGQVFKDIANKLGEAREAGRLSTTRQWTAAFAELSVAFYQSYVAKSVED